MGSCWIGLGWREGGGGGVDRLDRLDRNEVGDEAGEQDMSKNVSYEERFRFV